jgi:hypothetical protein
MRRNLLEVLAFVLAIVAGSVMTTRAHADSQKTFTVPVEWGQLRAANNDFLVFEDGQGVIRLAWINTGLQNWVEVQRVQTKH